MNRPYVICHMLTSVDGKIDGEFFSAPEIAPALGEYANLRKAFIVNDKNKCPSIF